MGGPPHLFCRDRITGMITPATTLALRDVTTLMAAIAPDIVVPTPCPTA